jgi:hypothetical protein
MAGKVATIKDFILNEDNLARQLVALYERWRIQKMEKEKEWRELRNYIFATDTSTTTNSTLPWKNRTTIPKLTQIRDNLHANYMDALFPNDDWLIWEGENEDDVTKQKREAIEAYMKNKCRLSGFRETISQCLYDYIDYGNVFLEGQWVNETHIDPLTKEEVVTYVGPKAVRISPFDIVFNPSAPAFEYSPKFTRYLKSIGELKKEMLYRTDLKFDNKVLEKSIKLRKNLSSFRMEDINKAEGYVADGFGTLSEYYGSGLVEIIEFEGDYYDVLDEKLYENKIITIIDRCYILRNIDNPSWIGRDNKVHVGWRDRPDNLYGMGPLDNLVGMQYRLDHLENLKADALDMTIMPPIQIKGEVEPFTWAPGVTVHVPEDGEVGLLPPNPAAFQVNNEIAGLMSLMEEMAGAPKQAMGIRTPGEKTAFEVQTLENAAGRIFHHKTNKFEIELLEKILNVMLELAKRNLSTKDLIRVMDDDLGVAEFINITKDDITAKGKLRPMGARHYAARAQLMQNLLGVYNSPIGQTIAPHTSAKALARLVEEAMGFERFKIIKDNIAVIEQAETQRLMNQVTKTVQAEDATPVEENMVAPQGMPPRQ